MTLKCVWQVEKHSLFGKQKPPQSSSTEIFQLIICFCCSRGDIEYCRTQLDEQPLIQLPPGASDSGSGYDCQRSPHFSKLNPGRCFDVTVHLKFQMKVKTDQRLSSASKTIQSACTNPLGLLLF